MFSLSLRFTKLVRVCPQIHLGKLYDDLGEHFKKF